VIGRRVETTALRRDGTEFPVELTVTRVDDEGPVRFTATARDITRRVHAEQEQRILASIVATSSDAIVGMALDGTIQTWNAGAERLYGHTAADATSRSIEMIVPGDRAEELAGILAQVGRGESVSEFETVRLRADGRPVDVAVSASPIRDGAGRVVGVSAISRDITRRKEAEERIAFLASHDSLTGLPNRAMLEDHLSVALARAERNGRAVALLYLDLDNFKLVNDSLGHQAGDELLRQVAGRLGEITRSTDVVARQGGDEFLLLLSDLEPDPADDPGHGAEEIAGLMARKIVSRLQVPFTLPEGELALSTSVGISIYPADAASADHLMRHADSAMYDAKRRGRGGYQFYAVGDPSARTELSLIARLRRAMSRDELVLHYQPLVDLRSDPEHPPVIGAEALLRWHDPQHGERLPGDFLPVAEQAGLMNTLTDWVLNEVFTQTRQWDRRGLDIDVAFNLPIAQLWRPHAARHILERLEEIGTDPNHLIMEITETAAMADPARTHAILRELADSGMKLAIDDFGTGHSSLSRLNQMPVSLLKIDRSFITHIPDDPQASALVSTIIQLARNLGIRPLAEGIESERQHRFLVEHECPLGQGFRFSQAVPAEELERMALA
jgi:diguanylate cyclase (GGDEF)-like protein/PAS domain S-box-containing protein